MTLEARDARDSDYSSFARMFLELRVPDPTPSEETYVERIRPYVFFLWEEEPVAYAFWQPLDEVARVMHVVVDSGAQGRGVGGSLMREVAMRARRAGCTRWSLNVKPDNTRAIRLYERCGMRQTGQWRSMEIAWADVVRLPLAESGADGIFETFMVPPEQDAGVERECGLPRGQIGVLRAGGGRVLIAVKRRLDGGIVGFAAFDPSFPGAMPFVAPRPWVVRRLLDAMRPHARPEHSAVRFAANNDDVWRAAEEAGGRTMLEVMSMEGRIATL